MIVSYKSYTSIYIKSSTTNLMKVVMFLLIKVHIHHFNYDDEYVHDLKLDIYILKK